MLSDLNDNGNKNLSNRIYPYPQPASIIHHPHPHGTGVTQERTCASTHHPQPSSRSRAIIKGKIDYRIPTSQHTPHTQLVVQSPKQKDNRVWGRSTGGRSTAPLVQSYDCLPYLALDQRSGVCLPALPSSGLAVRCMLACPT